LLEVEFDKCKMGSSHRRTTVVVAAVAAESIYEDINR